MKRVNYVAQWRFGGYIQSFWEDKEQPDCKRMCNSFRCSM